MGDNSPCTIGGIAMKKVMKRITAAVLAAAVAVGALMTSASAYEACESWDIVFVNQLPNREEGSCERTLRTYGGGYQTYCEDIHGGNDCYVLVYAQGISEYMITQKGYSNVKNCYTQGNAITFHFHGRSSSTCWANGTVGYFK